MMGEMRQAMKYLAARKPTVIIRYPTGKFGIAGSIPVALTEEYGGMFPGRRSMTWDSQAEVEDALNAIGVTDFKVST